MTNSSVNILQDSSVIFGSNNINQKVARGICIAKTPLKPDVSSCLVFFPPRCSCSTFQLCGDAIEGKKLLNAAIKSFFLVPSISPANITTEGNGNLEELQPTLLWHALHIQELSMGSVGPVSSMPMPDMNLNYNDAIEATAKYYQILQIFRMMYPNEEFFPETVTSDIPEENDDIDTKTEP